MAKIRRAQNSEFGRRHHFREIRSVEDFRQRVALQTYEEVEPYLKKVRQGQMEALFAPSEKIKMFALSSGPTSQPKTIPVTRAFLKEYKQGSFLWGIYCAQDHPEFFDGKILPIVSPACEEKTPLGIPCGAISGLIAQTQTYVARSLYPVPGAAYELSDAETRDYVLLRFALPEKITLVTSANPSSLIRLARCAERHRENLIRDIHDGTLRLPRGADVADLDRWRDRLKPRPDAARALNNRCGGGLPFHPRHFWPHLVLLACWKGGTLSSYLPQVRELYGEKPIRDLGLLSSEGRMTIPIHDDGSAGVLDLQSHFFEFLPEEEPFHPRARTLLGHELEPGKKYFILLTTSAGLYRYHIHDLVEVEGFFHQTPLLRFLNKGVCFSSLTGEKISEFQVVQAVNRSAMKHQIALERFLLAPRWGDPPGYLLCVEEDGSVGKERWNRFLEEMEQLLQAINSEYRSKRKSARLAPPQLFFVARGSFQKWDAQARQRQTGRFEQFKPRFLSNDLSFAQEFAKLIVY